MTNNWSKFGDRFARPTGASELMEDLGLAAALKNDGIKSIPLLGWQIPIITDGNFFKS